MRHNSTHLSARAVALLVFAAIGLAALTPFAGAASHRATAKSTLSVCPASRSIESWEAAPSDSSSTADARLMPFVHGPDQTLRMIITPHYGGSLIRVRLSNTFGSGPVTVDAVAIADSQSGAAPLPGSARTVLFSGNPSATIPAGGQAVSDR